jgi:hypothetical protein
MNTTMRARVLDRSGRPHALRIRRIPPPLNPRQDDERILVFHRYSGRGKTSGLEIGQIASKGADLFHITDGKVTRLVLYWDCECAVVDLGLREWRWGPARGNGKPPGPQAYP